MSSCSLCGHDFGDLQALDQHLEASLKHASCGCCQQGFVWGHALKQHLQIPSKHKSHSQPAQTISKTELPLNLQRQKISASQKSSCLDLVSVRACDRIYPCSSTPVPEALKSLASSFQHSFTTFAGSTIAISPSPQSVDVEVVAFCSDTWVLSLFPSATPSQGRRC
jgi:hypothetical protein